jgi:hypothetical protein
MFDIKTIKTTDIAVTIKDETRGSIIVFKNDSGEMSDSYRIVYEILDFGGSSWELAALEHPDLSSAMTAVANLIKLNIENDFYYEG